MLLDTINMETLIKDIQNRLTEIPQLKYIDVDWGQLDYYDSPPVKYPCCLLDIVQGDFTDAGNLAQIGLIGVEIRLVDLLHTNTSAKAPEGQKNRAFDVLRLLTEIYKKLHGWHGLKSNYGTLTRRNFSRVNREDGLKEYRMLFLTEITDQKAFKPAIMTLVKGVDIEM